MGKEATYELFNLASDPKEQKNIAPSNPKLVQELLKKLEEEFARYQEASIPSREKELNPLEEERLRALGYIQ
jgi:hypothetical protein